MREPPTWKAIAAGVCALILTVGLSRFAYTPMLPVMRAETWLTDVAGGWLAAANYAGYMTGALAAATLSSLRAKFRMYRAGLVLALASTVGMGLTDDAIAWGVLRFLGGLGSTAGMLLASGLIMNWLIRMRRRPELGLHFAGMGLGIVVSGVAAGLMAGAFGWARQWQLLGLLGMVFLIPAWAWLPAPQAPRAAATPHVAASSAHAPGSALPPGWLAWSALAYVCAGVGYVVSATFLVAIVEALPAMRGLGAAAWVVVGLAAAPATWIWDRVSRRLGETPALLLAYAMQIVSIVLPVLADGTLPTMTAAALYGVTFMGIVSMTLSNIGRRFPSNPAKAMARLTLGYGAAQVAAPAITGYLAERSGSYQSALLMAAAVMALGMACLWQAGARSRGAAGATAAALR